MGYGERPSSSKIDRNSKPGFEYPKSIVGFNFQFSVSGSILPSPRAFDRHPWVRADESNQLGGDQLRREMGSAFVTRQPNHAYHAWGSRGSRGSHPASCIMSALGPAESCTISEDRLVLHATTRALPSIQKAHSSPVLHSCTPSHRADRNSLASWVPGCSRSFDQNNVWRKPVLVCIFRM